MRPVRRVAELGSLGDSRASMLSQRHFEIAGVVSVWVGNFKDDVQFDDYMNLSAQFAQDFGFAVDVGARSEGVVESIPMPIAELVRGFSSWESFAPAVVAAAKKIGLPHATTMLVLYCVQFEPAKVRVNSSAPLKFIGAFPFHYVHRIVA